MLAEPGLRLRGREKLFQRIWAFQLLPTSLLGFQNARLQKKPAITIWLEIFLSMPEPAPGHSGKGRSQASCPARGIWGPLSWGPTSPESRGPPCLFLRKKLPSEVLFFRIFPARPSKAALLRTLERPATSLQSQPTVRDAHNPGLDTFPLHLHHLLCYTFLVSPSAPDQSIPFYFKRKYVFNRF